MPRASNGTYTLPAGNPVVTATTISSSWANNTLSDLATAMSDSLSRSGDGGMTAALELLAGVVGAPGLTWSADTTSGLYRAGAADFRYSIAATDVLKLLADATLLRDGTVGAPGVSFISDTDIGMYRIGANTLGFAVSGTRSLQIDANLSVGVRDGTAALPSLCFIDDTDTGVFRSGTNGISLASGGATALTADTVSVYFRDGTAANPALTFLSDTDLGLYRVGANQLGVTCGNSLTVLFNLGHALGDDGTVGAPMWSFFNDTDIGMYRISNNYLGFAASGAFAFGASSGQIRLASGAASTPSLSFDSDSNTGLYFVTADQLGFATGGARRMYLADTGLIMDTTFFAIDGSVGAPSITFGGDTDTGMWRGGADDLRFVVGSSTVALQLLNTAGAIQALFPVGTVGNPGISLTGDIDTGIYRVSGNILGFTCGGIQALAMSELAAAFAGTVQAADGTVGTPAFSFASDTNTGVYRPAADRVAFSAGGTIVFEANNTLGVGLAYARVYGSFLIPDGLTAPATHASCAQLYVDLADGDLKVKFADGTVKTLATDT